MSKLLHYKVFENENKENDYVVLIHGAGGSSSIFYKQIREYKKHFNVLILDLRGHGKSKNPILLSKEYTLQDISEDVVEVLNHLNIKSAHFVGISLGTIVIRTISDSHPEMIKSAVLGGAVTRLTARPNILFKIANSVKHFIPYMLLYKIFAFAIMPKKKHENSRLLFVQEAKKVAQKEFLKWSSIISTVNPVLKYYEEKETSVPMLYLMGSEDYMFLGPVKAICKKRDNFDLYIMEGVGHVCNVDDSEGFNRISIEYMHKHS